MNVVAGVRFGPVICRVEHIEDCRPAARLLVARMRHVAQVVFMDIGGNVHLSPGFVQIPPQAMRWVIGCYNRDATIEIVSSDLANELRERRDMYKALP